MQMRLIKTCVASFLLLLVTNVWAGSPHYADLKLSDSADGDATESFDPTTAKIYLNASLVDVPSGAKLSSTWIAEDTKGVAPPNYKIDSVDYTAGALTNVATFSLSKPNAGWPVGTYRVDLFIDGKAASTVHFKIEADN